MLFHHWTPLAYLAMPNWFLYIIICGNIHAGCSGVREFFSVAAAFAGPALLYGSIFFVFQKGLAGISKHTEGR
jgi:hypothetical protein